MRAGTRGSPKRYCSVECRRVAWALRKVPEMLARAVTSEQQPERDPELFRPIYERGRR